MAAAGKWVFEAAKRIIQTEPGKRALATAAMATSRTLSKFGKERLGKRRVEKEQRELAESLARQVGGRVSYDTIIGGARYTVVWADGKPLAAFPPPEGDQALEERRELQNFNPELWRDPLSAPQVEASSRSSSRRSGLRN